MARTLWPFRGKGDRKVVASGDSGRGRWRLTMPEGWAQRDPENRATYFQSADSTKGIYISFWETQEASAAEAMPRFERARRSTLAEMEGYEWSFPDEQRDSTRNLWLLDAYAEAKGYRIVNLVTIQLPFVLSASFHDYGCDDYAKSREYFAPIIASLELNADDA